MYCGWDRSLIRLVQRPLPLCKLKGVRPPTRRRLKVARLPRINRLIRACRLPPVICTALQPLDTITGLSRVVYVLFSWTLALALFRRQLLRAWKELA